MPFAQVVNSVNFSNHAGEWFYTFMLHLISQRLGYGRSGGTKATAHDLTEIFESMEQNGLLNPSRLLTGD